MIIKIFDYTTQKTESSIDGIVISEWAYGRILNWRDEERLEKLYKEYREKNLEYLEMEIMKEDSNFYIIKKSEYFYSDFFMLKDYFINVTTSFKSLRSGELGTSSSDTPSAIIAIKLYSSFSKLIRFSISFFE